MTHITKWITYFVLIANQSTMAQTANPLMQCLGNEELKIHRAKSTGPAYFLNQLFINELSSFYGLSLKDEYLNAICKNSNYSPSVVLLWKIIIYGRELFKIPKNSIKGGAYIDTFSTLDGFLEKIPSTFFQYLGKLQSLAPTAPCLESKIPEISYFIDRFKYLEEEIHPSTLLAEKKKIDSIFKKLIHLDKYIKDCEKVKQLQDKHKYEEAKKKMDQRKKVE